MGFISPDSSECGNLQCRACYDKDGVYKMGKGASAKRTSKPSEREALAKTAPPPGTEESATKHITEYPDLVDIVPELAAESVQLGAKIKPMEARRKEIGSDIRALLDAAGARSVRGDGWTVVYYPDSESWVVTEEKLLTNGVTMDTIIKSRVKSVKAGYVQVTAPRGQSNG